VKQVQITDGTTTLTFAGTTSGSYDGLIMGEYVPRYPQLDRVQTQQASTPGGEIVAAVYRNVTESATLRLQRSSSASMANAITDMQSLHKLIDAARRYQRDRVGNPVYVKFRKDTGESYYRSEILDARVDMEDDSLESPGPYDAGYIQLEITWTRRYFWEAESETALTLVGYTNTSSSGTTIKNATNGADQNSVTCADAIAGDLPTPAYVALTNTSGGQSYDNYWIGLQADGTVAQIALEGESGSGSGANTAQASASGGNVRRVNVLLNTQVAVQWSLTTTQVDNAAGRYYRAVLVIGSSFVNPTGMRLWLDIQTTGSTTIWTGPVMQPADAVPVLDMGLVQLPPVLNGLTGFEGLNLRLNGYNTIANSDLDVDTLYLLPTDSIRSYILPLSSIGDTEALVDNGYAGVSYRLTASGKSPVVTATGSPNIELRPGSSGFRANVLWWSGAATPINTSSLVMKYRARRLLL
jgi:hypothetical protein